MARKKKEITILVDGKPMAASLFHPDLVEEHLLIEDLWKSRETYLKAKTKFAEFLEEKVVKRLHVLNATLSERDQVKQVAIFDIDKKRKALVIRRDYVRLSEKALRAKTIIDGVVQEMQSQAGEGDSAQIISILSGLFVGAKSLSLNSNLVRFMNGMQFTDVRLREAQELLKEAIQTDTSRHYVNLFERGEKGDWQSAESL